MQRKMSSALEEARSAAQRVGYLKENREEMDAIHWVRGRGLIVVESEAANYVGRISANDGVWGDVPCDD